MGAVKLKIKKGDNVQVIAGENKGREGKVLEVLVERSRVIIEGVNIITKHVKPTAQNTQGGIVKTEAPIHISNVMVLDPKSGKPTRVGRKMINGKNERVATKSGEVIK